jgi:signal transduction histidine kinase
LWETGWFRAGVALLLVGALAGSGLALARSRYKRRLALLETQHAIERERLRISQDMHDHIGGLLTRVSILSDVGESDAGREGATRGQFEKIGRQVRSAVQALDEIVWVTNPKNDNLRRFADYVGRFADEFFEGSPVRCWQEMPTDLPNLPLRADLRHNVFLAVKEALNNVLKHSGATEIWLRLSLDGATVRLGIEDNGIGFRPDQVAEGGNGLDNMRTRLIESGGCAEFISAPGQGAKIYLSFPLAARG